MAEINIEFPDGSVKPFEQGVSILDIAKSSVLALLKKLLLGKLTVPWFVWTKLLMKM